MRLKRMIITNFQRHKRLRVDFGEGITSIVGQSDRGKSSAIRALIWVLTNKPGGDSFITNGERECKVKLFFDDGKILERIKSKKENVYKFEGKEFKALRAEVPQEIADYLKVDENNLQSQHDPLYWFSESSGEISRRLNRIVNLDIIDHTFKGLSDRKREEDSKVTALHAMQEDCKAKLKLSEPVKRFQNLQHKIEVVGEKLHRNDKSLDRLNGRIDGIEKMQGKAGRYAEAQESITECLNDIDSFIKVVKDMARLAKLESGMFLAQMEIDESERADKVLGIVEKTLKLNEKKGIHDLNIDRLDNMIEDAEKYGKRIRLMEEESKELEERFHKALDGKVCPLCGRS